MAHAINSFFFHALEELSDEVYELKMYKKKMKCNLPIQIGFFVFTYSKLHMLEFYYHSQLQKRERTGVSFLY